MPTPFNPWTGAIQMWPMQPHGGSILGAAPRSGPRPHAYMAGPPAPAAFSYNPHGGVPHGQAFYGAPYGVPTPAPSTSTQTWDPAALAQHFTNMTLQPPTPEWVMDSGATAHRSNNTGILSSLSAHPPYRHIMVGDGSSIPVSASGHASLPSSLSARSLHLRNVLVTPRIIKNLVSVRQFTTDNNCFVNFDPFGFSVKDLITRRELLRCNSTGELYSFQPPAPRALTATTTSHDIWHRRLGHPGHDAYRRLLQHISLPCNKNSSNLCHACQLGRHVRLPFSSSTTKTTRPFELIHCDLWTSPILSNSGNKYFLVILDDFTHFLWTIPLRQKSDAYASLASIRAFAQTQFNLPLAAIQMDNGREFDNAKLHTLAAAHGIHLRFSCPYTSPQNGKAERIIRTVNDIVRSLLFQASLPPRFWVEALHHATYVLNRLPTKAISAPSPYFALHDTHPDYSSLRVFGCLCYPNTAATMPHKLAPRSSACMFLGYSPHHKGYRCMDLTTHRIIVSRHVIFDESTFPFTSPQPPTAASYEFLDDVPPLPVMLPHAPAVHAPSPPPSPQAPTPPLVPSPPPAPPSPPPVHRTRSTSSVRVPPPRTA